MNKVTVYSNGMVDYSRSIKVEGNQIRNVVIPVNKADMGDVLSTLVVHGNAHKTPYVFTPENNQQGFYIDPKCAYDYFFSAFCGAEISIQISSDNSIKGIISGTQVTVNKKSEEAEKSVIIMSDGVFKSINYNSIRDWNFCDKKIQQKVAKELSNSIQKINPDLSTIEFELSSKEDENATIQYSTPGSVWKLSYKLFQNKNNSYIEGYAVVDNTTKEDWTDVKLSVVLGQPISFRTNLADIVTPNRNYADATQDEDGAIMECMSFGGMPKAAPAIASRSAKYVATVDNIRTTEIEDYCVYESKDLVTIKSEQSSVVLLFRDELSTETLLSYDSANSSAKANRIVKFKAPRDFGKGVCSLYKDEISVGMARISNIKKDDYHRLAYAVETGVKFDRTNKPISKKVVGVKVNDGVALVKKIFVEKTEYVIENKKDELFKVELNYKPHNSNGILKFELSSEYERTNDGILFNLKPKETLKLSISESILEQLEYVFGKNMDLSWITNQPELAEDEHFSKMFNSCVDIQLDIDQVLANIQFMENSHNRLKEKYARMQSNLSVTANVGQAMVEKWTQELNDIGCQIDEIVTKTEDLKNEEVELRNKLQNNILEFSIDWKNNVDLPD